MKTYSLKQCKADMLLIWGILKANPHIISKPDAIKTIADENEVKRLLKLECLCPCCEYASLKSGKDIKTIAACEYCPCWDIKIDENCTSNDPPSEDNQFMLWYISKDAKDRKHWATMIYNRALLIDC